MPLPVGEGPHHPPLVEGAALLGQGLREAARDPALRHGQQLDEGHGTRGARRRALAHGSGQWSSLVGLGSILVSVNIEARLVDALEARIVPRRSDVLRVCLVVPQSGALGMVGPSALDAALLATHEINVADGVGGRYVDLVLVDGGRAPVDVAEVRALCDAGAVDVVTGIHTSDVHRAVESVVAGRTPYVFTPPHEGGPRRTGVVCTGAHPASQLSGPLAWLTATYSLRRWALVGNDYIWPQAVHRVAHRLVRRGGAEVVMDERIPLGRVTRAHAGRIVEGLRRSRADAVLLSLVGRDLADFTAVLRHSGLDRTLVRLSGSLEENGLYAVGGDESGTMFAAMQSFASLGDENRPGSTSGTGRCSGRPHRSSTPTPRACTTGCTWSPRWRPRACCGPTWPPPTCCGSRGAPAGDAPPTWRARTARTSPSCPRPDFLPFGNIPF